jgi:hypothetical protein
MRLPRMTMRRWLIAIAVVALAIDTAIDRRPIHQRWVSYHEREMERSMRWLNNYQCLIKNGVPGVTPGDSQFGARLAKCQDEADLHARQRIYHLCGTVLPWLSFPSDQPPAP